MTAVAVALAVVYLLCVSVGVLVVTDPQWNAPASGDDDDPVAAPAGDVSLCRPRCGAGTRKEDEMTECTLWYWTHGFVECTVYDSEDAAVHAAIWMQEDGDAAPAGVQFPDGSYIPVEEWPAYLAENRRLTRAATDSANRSVSQPATRQIRPPFDHDRMVTVPADIPSWVGRQVSLAGEGSGGATRSAESARATTSLGATTEPGDD